MYVYNDRVVRKTTKFGKVKGGFMIANGLAGGLFCILAGQVVIGIVLAVLCVAAGILYYMRKPSYARWDDDYTLTSPRQPYLLIASYFIALALSLITGITAGKLGELWVAIALVFVTLLLLQIWFWKETAKQAVRELNDEGRIDIYSGLADKIRSGEILCGGCHRKVTDFYSIAVEDDGVAVLCSDCLEWKGKDRRVDFQGMTFVQKRL